jgi:hypothetical protein
MDVTKTLSADPALGGSGATAPRTASSSSAPAQPSLATAASSQPETAISTAPAAPLADRLDIQPLDLAAALQILIAEVRTELALSVELSVPADVSVMQSAAVAPQTIVQMFLQALPAAPHDMTEMAAWMGAVIRAEATLQVALDQGVAAVTTWRDVPQAVVDGAAQTRAVILGALTTDLPNPLWLRPEWLGLAPAIHSYRRRRSSAARRLRDPDLNGRADDFTDDEQRADERQGPSEDESA